MDARQRLKEARRVVVKVGTSTLAHETGMLNLYRIDHLLRELADLMNEGREIILVSSGAIAAGLSKLGLAKKPDSIPESRRSRPSARVCSCISTRSSSPSTARPSARCS